MLAAMIKVARSAGDFRAAAEPSIAIHATSRTPLIGNTVVHVAEFGAPYASNFISSLQALGPCLKEVGLRQVLVLPARAKRRSWAVDWQASETPLFFLSERNLWERGKEVARIVRQQGGILIHSHFCPADWISWFAWLRLKSMAGSAVPVPPLMWHYQSPPVSDGLARHVLGPLKYRLLGRSIHHVAVSQGTLETMLEKGIPKHLCHLVCNSINFERSTSPVVSRAQMRSTLAIAPEQKCLLQFGHDPERKGVDLALKAFGKLFASHPEVVLVIVGEERLRRYVRATLGQSRPAWLRLVEPRETVADYYGAADFFLSPSRSEGLPYAVLEALANRLPVIASDIPGLEWARGLEAVRLCLPGSEDSLSRHLSEALRQEAATREAATAHACDYIRARHSSVSWAREMLQIYSSLLGLPKHATEPPTTASTTAAVALVPVAPTTTCTQGDGLTMNPA